MGELDDADLQARRHALLDEVREAQREDVIAAALEEPLDFTEHAPGEVRPHGEPRQRRSERRLRGRGRGDGTTLAVVAAPRRARLTPPTGWGLTRPECR